jgi:hypothetical protein
MGIYASEEIQILHDLDSSSPSSLQADRLPDGGWIVTWIDASESLVTRRFDASGTPVGNKVEVYANADLAYSRPIFALSDGGWVQSFYTSAGASGEKLHVVRYDAAGLPQATHVSTGYTHPSLLKLAGDHYVSFSASQKADGNFKISATFFGPDGQATATIPLGTTTTPNLSLEALPSGEWSIFLSEEGQNGRYQLLEADGTLVNSVDAVENGTIAFDTDGSYTIRYSIRDFDDSTLTLIDEHRTSDGQLETTVTYPVLNYSTPFMLALTHTLANGNQVVVWSDYGAMQNAPVYLRILGPNGEIVVSDVQLTGVYAADGGRVVELSTGAWVLAMGNHLQVINADGSLHGGPVPVLGTSDIVADDSGGWTAAYFGSHDNAETYGFYSRRFEPNDINNAPLALSGFYNGMEDQAVAFEAVHFQSYEPDGDAIAKIVIETLPETGLLTFNGVEVSAGQIIDIADVGKLAWTTPQDVNGKYIDSIGYDVIDEHGARSGQAGLLRLTASGTEDIPVATDLTITIREDQKFHLTPDMFPVTDVDGQVLAGMDVTTILNNGSFTVAGDKLPAHGVIEWLDLDSMYFQSGRNTYGDGHAEFTVKYITGYQSVSDEYSFTINVLPVNDVPVAQKASLMINAGSRTGFIDQLFHAKDVEGDAIESLVIAKLPEAGVLRLGKSAVKVGDEIAYADTLRLNYQHAGKGKDAGSTEFKYYLRDSGGMDNGGDDLSKAATFEFEVKKDKVLMGSAGSDSLKGREADEIFYGGAGKDTIHGRGGDDLLFGGSGMDVFSFSADEGLDHIMDFDVSQDQIDLRHTDIPSFAYLKTHHNQYSEGLLGLPTTKRDDSLSAIHLKNVVFEELTEDNFIF